MAGRICSTSRVVNTSGGRWKMMDLGHVELRRKGVLGKQPAPRQ
jgi:hypothetical protein